MARMQAGGTLWSLGLALLCVLLTHDILSTRKHSWMPSAVATLAAAAVSANFGWLLFLHQSEEHGSKDHSFLGMVLLLSLLSLGSSFALMVRQMQEAVVDKADLKKLEQVMVKLDADDDGHVDKVEFKSIYQEVFPGFGGTYEELWVRLDRNKDGKLSKEELALALGLNHLTTAGFAEDDSPSEALARELAAKQDEDDDDDVDEKLHKLQAEKMRLRKHHLRPGGVMIYFFVYDVITTSLLFGWILYSNWRNGISRGDWRYDTSLYFTKVATIYIPCDLIYLIYLAAPPDAVGDIRMHMHAHAHAHAHARAHIHMHTRTCTSIHTHAGGAGAPLDAVRRLHDPRRHQLAHDHAADRVRQGGQMRTQATAPGGQPTL